MDHMTLCRITQCEAEHLMLAGRSCGAELPDPPARTYVTAIVRKAVTR